MLLLSFEDYSHVVSENIMSRLLRRRCAMRRHAMIYVVSPFYFFVHAARCARLR